MIFILAPSELQKEKRPVALAVTDCTRAGRNLDLQAVRRVRCHRWDTQSPSRSPSHRLVASVLELHRGLRTRPGELWRGRKLARILTRGTSPRRVTSNPGLSS